jgi:MFS family permease
LFWPLFGLSVALGALLTLRLSAHHDRRHLLVVCYGLQAIGVMLSVWWPSLPGFALGSLLLGLPFTAITLFAMQEARRLRPQDASSFIGLITAAYGLGQIAGPPMVAWLLGRSETTQQGFTTSLQIAASALLLGMFMFGALARRHPLERASGSADTA